MSKDKPELNDVTRREQLKIYDELAEIINKFLNSQPNDLKHALSVSALIHLTAQTIGESACCPYHGLQLWATVGHDVMVQIRRFGDDDEPDEREISFEDFGALRRPRTKLH